MSRLLNCWPVCFICRRSSSGFAISDSSKQFGPFCADCGPGLAKKVWTMNTKEFDRYEEDALKIASHKIGDHLDMIGKTDLATMTEAEWNSFLAVVVKEFGAGMRLAVADLEPPF